MPQQDSYSSSSRPLEALAGGRLTIDLDAIATNWRTLSEHLRDGTECAATVKANAYGTGLCETAERLSQEGCRTFFVALPQEALHLRETLPDATIYVLDGLFPGTAATYAAANLRPVLNSVPEIEEWSAYCRAGNKPLAAAIHIDTGMNRLGLMPDMFAQVMADDYLTGAFTPCLFVSHLACGSTPDHPLNQIQLDTFRAATAEFPEIPKSLANSAGVFLGPDYHFDIARPGISLYGGKALDPGTNPMVPVVKVEARILMVRDVAENQKIGYGGAKTATKPMRLAIVAAGYADGFLRRAGSSDKNPGGFGWLDGHRVPIVGRISMDMMALDVTDVPETVARHGVFVELLGPNVAASDLAIYAETIDYEYLTGLGRRFHRRYGTLGLRQDGT
ncbi:alanine racemase [uncultured Roseibium sp.]|uniref:alanine racemase n=1 Tax=uncultured Roseibium sp. TaxID=1936171 RepID=UPI0032178262